MVVLGVLHITLLLPIILCYPLQASGMALPGVPLSAQPQHGHQQQTQKPLRDEAAADEVVDEVQDLPYMQDEEYSGH